VHFDIALAAAIKESDAIVTNTAGRGPKVGQWGSATLTEPNDTSVISGTLALFGTLVVLESADTFVSAGTNFLNIILFIDDLGVTSWAKNLAVTSPNWIDDNGVTG
jgi:hypothetical protein